jgi:AraC-like DNA-binding protein
MEYRELAPARELAADVACVWFDDRLRPPAAERTQLVLPDGCIDIIWTRGLAPTIAGPATLPVVAELVPDAAVLGIRFWPGRAPAFLGVPADALLNCTVPLRDVWGDEAERLGEALEQTDTVKEGLQVLEAAVLERHADPADPLVSAAVKHLNGTPDAQVSQLGDYLGISERQLLRRFQTAVGYGPKVLGRVLRFQRFVALLYEPRVRSWDLARLAAEAGYADHAHLTRECARLAGTVPSALRPAPWSAAERGPSAA